MFNSPVVITGFNNVTVMSDSIEQSGCHFLVPKDRRPFTESEISGDNDRGSLVELRQQMEDQLSAVFRERQIAQFVQYDQFGIAGQPVSEPSPLAGDFFLFQ